MVVQVIDRPLLRRRLSRALIRHVPGADFLLRRVVAELGERLSDVQEVLPVAIASGGQGDALREELLASGKVGEVIRLEPVAEAFTRSSTPGVVADEEVLPLAPGSVNLFASALSLQWANDIPGALVQIRTALRPSGLFIAGMMGGRTLAELREALFVAETELSGGASLRVMPAVDVRDAGALLQRAGFTRPVADAELLTARYATLDGLFTDLRGMGATNALTERSRRPRPAPRELFRRTADIYSERFGGPDGRIRASFDVIWLSGRAPP